MKTKAQEKKELLAYMARIQKNVLKNISRRNEGSFSMGPEFEIKLAIQDIIVEEMVINIKPLKKSR